VLSRLKTIKTILKFEYNDSRRVRWWLKDETFVPVAKSIEAAVRDIESNVIPDNIKILKRSVFKHTERKTVFSIQHPQNPERLFVAKIFFLVHTSHKLNYRLYGLDEAANSIQARTKGISTPEIYGCGHIYNKLGFVKASVVIFEILRHVTTIGELMRIGPYSERAEILMSTVPLFISLYKANCNHIDVNHSAVVMSGNNLGHKLYLLDFHHAKFYDKPSIEVLMFEAGCFAKSCRDWISDEMVDKWLDRLLTVISVNGAADRQKVKEYFDYYCVAALSRKQRRTLIE